MSTLGWSPLSEIARKAAASAGTSERTQRRRILAMDAACGGGLVRSLAEPGKPPRKHLVNIVALEGALRRDPEARAAELEWVATQVEKMQQSIAALKKASRQHKKRIDGVIDVIDGWTASATVGQQLQLSLEPHDGHGAPTPFPESGTARVRPRQGPLLTADSTDDE